MLELRPNSECCDADLSPSTEGAYICSFECTSCASCAEGRLGLDCPNCGGRLFERPTRLLANYPAVSARTPLSTKRPEA